MAPRNRKLATCSVSASGDANASVETDVSFPTDYFELLEQVKCFIIFPLHQFFWLIVTFSFNIDGKCSGGLVS